MCFGLPRIIELNGQKPPLTYKRFQALISRMELPKKPAVAVSSQQMESCRAEIQENHDDTYGVPSLEELGECPTAHHTGRCFLWGTWPSCFLVKIRKYWLSGSCLQSLKLRDRGRRNRPAWTT